MLVDFEKLRMKGAGKAIAILTSGGDAQGKSYWLYKPLFIGWTLYSLSVEVQGSHRDWITELHVNH